MTPPTHRRKGKKKGVYYAVIDTILASDDKVVALFRYNQHAEEWVGERMRPDVLEIKELEIVPIPRRRKPKR